MHSLLKNLEIYGLRPSKRRPLKVIEMINIYRITTSPNWWCSSVFNPFGLNIDRAELRRSIIPQEFVKNYLDPDKAFVIFNTMLDLPVFICLSIFFQEALRAKLKLCHSFTVTWFYDMNIGHDRATISLIGSKIFVLKNKDIIYIYFHS